MLQQQSKARVILHVDMNSFFASVEQAYDPSLKNLPLAVAGNPQHRRGIIVTCSYEARAYGVYTTMTVGEARRLCPNLVIIPPDRQKYERASAAVFTILQSYTELVEPVSIDEAYVDITNIGGLTNAINITKDIQERILHELDLPCSIGIGPNKFLAKTASDMKKPMGITILRKRQIKKVLWPLPVIEMHGVGKSTEKKLAAINIQTIGDLAKANDAILKTHIGLNGIRLKERANGLDYRSVDPEAANERKSVGTSTTLPIDETELEACVKIFNELAHKTASRLKKAELAGTVIMIQIRTADWRNQTRSKTMMNPIYEEEDIYREAKRLFERHWDREPVRLLGITISNVIPVQEVYEQLSIYNFEKHASEQEMEGLVTTLNKQFGSDTIKRGINE